MRLLILLIFGPGMAMLWLYDKLRVWLLRHTHGRLRAFVERWPE